MYLNPVRFCWFACKSPYSALQCDSGQPAHTCSVPLVVARRNKIRCGF